MTRLFFLAAAAATAATCAPCLSPSHALEVPPCPGLGTISYNKTLPDELDFPRTEVDLCYTPTHISLRFTARDELHFFYNASQRTNDDIWKYEVMEAFVSRGHQAPQTYLEFEVNPANVTYQAMVYNPSKTREPGAPFEHFFVGDPAASGFSADTALNRSAHVWKSNVLIPLGLFNVDKGQGRGTKWRMNFFRTVVGPGQFPNQTLGAWSRSREASFHITPAFGFVNFV